jgi:hypothetical protein
LILGSRHNARRGDPTQIGFRARIARPVLLP